MIKQIYLDNSATTPVREEVKEAMSPYLSDCWGNPSSLHEQGRAAAKALDTARQQIARLLNCLPEEIYFSPCGTYSNNTAIIGRARFCEANGLGKHMITCQIEHPAVLGPAKHLESQGWRITYLPVDHEGFVDIADLKKQISADTSIISIMWANNEIGTVQPIAELTEIAEASGIYFHTDAVQVPGKLPIDTSAVKLSSLSLSGHKFYAPKGIGVLYLRKGINVMPLVYGGGQERSLFPGTEGLANIVAIGKAAELAYEELEETQSLLRNLQKLLTDRLLAIPGLKLTGPLDPERRLPGHLSLVVSGADGEALVMKSDLQGVAISSGSACHQGIKSPSRILTSIGISDHDALGSARISVGKFNTTQQCREAAEILAKVLTSSKKLNSKALAQ
jgi:cysteine desulfurase